MVFEQRRRIYLMRHGEVGYVVDGRPVPPDQAELTEEGRLQCIAAAQALADVTFDRVLVTGLLRTEQTAKLVLGARDVPLTIVPELREIRSGRLDGLPPDERRAMFVESLTHRLRPEVPFLGGETFAAFEARVLPAFQALLADRSWSCMLLVAHGATNRVLLGSVLGAGLSNAPHIEQDAGCINSIDIDSAGYGIVRLMNYTPYNPAKLEMSLTTMERYFLALPESGPA